MTEKPLGATGLIVDPTAVKDGAADLKKDNDTVGGIIADLIASWNALSLGWAGESAEEAQEFFEDWTRAFEKFFGARERPEEGALNAISTAASEAAHNYGLAEEKVLKLFQTGDSEASLESTLDDVVELGPIHRKPNAP